MSSHIVAEGEKDAKTYTLLVVNDAFERIYVTIFREGLRPADVRGPHERTAARSKVYYQAYATIEEAVRNCVAWLDLVPLEDRPTMEPPEPTA